MAELIVKRRKVGGGPSKKTAPRWVEHCAHSQRLCEGLLDLNLALISFTSSRATLSSTTRTRLSMCRQKVA